MLGLERTASNEIIPIHSKLSFGRENCDILLSHPSASRRHFQVLFEKGQLSVVDLGSSQGTFVNGKRIREDEQRVLNQGDNLGYGTCQNDMFKVIECGIGNEGVIKARDKITKLKLERDRILAKEGGSRDLSDGQQRVLDKNLNEIRSLEKHIMELVQKNNSSTTQNTTQDEDEYWDAKFNDDEDEGTSKLLDLTKINNTNNNQIVQTYDSLLKKISEIDYECKQINEQLEQLGSSSETTTTEEEEDVDELDRFMEENAKMIKENDIDKLKKKFQELLIERARCETLANIAKPALSNYRQTIVNNKPIPSLTIDTMTTKSTNKEQFRVIQEGADIIQKPIEKKRMKESVLKMEEEEAINTEKNVDESPSEWKPPNNQKGDGKTSANQKYGY